MASEDAAGKDETAKSQPDKSARFVGGPRAIGALIPTVTRPAFRARSPAAAQLMGDWVDIVGPALSLVTQPKRLADGTLTLACAGPIALELQHLTGQLADRINAHFGRPLVQRFRFLQGDVIAAQAQPTHRRSSPTPIDVPGLPPGELREALAQLGGTVAESQPALPARPRGRDPA